VVTVMSEQETQALLREVSEAYHTQINDVLLTGLGQAMEKWTGSREVLVNLEGHGREELFEEVDLTGTVGWFTSLFPVHLKLGRKRGAGEELKAIKEQLRGIPRRGIGYGVLRYGRVEEVREQLKKLPQPEISFNYLGQFDQVLGQDSWFGPAGEDSGASLTAGYHRPHELDITGSISGGQLRTVFTYSENLHRRPTISRLAAGYTAALQSIIEHCRNADSGGHLVDAPLIRQHSNGSQDLDHVINTEKDVLVPIQTLGTCPPLFCVHSGDGTANGYFELAHELGPEQPVYGLEALGVNGTGRPQRRIEDMAETYLKAIRHCQAKGPYYLGGWSFGGIIAFEMAQQLLLQGEDIALLTLFDTRRPGGEQRISPSSVREEVAKSVVEGLIGRLGMSSTIQLPHNLDDQLALLVQQAHASGLLPPNVGLADLERQIDFGAAHLWARRSYKPEAYAGKIVLFKAAGVNSTVPASNYGWSAVAQKGVEVIEVPGTHASLLSGPCAKIVASRLQQFLIETKTLQ
jgi:non-ribosomal peptide synthase protein (TIGR01720 family)